MGAILVGYAGGRWISAEADKRLNHATAARTSEVDVVYLHLMVSSLTASHSEKESTILSQMKLPHRPIFPNVRISPVVWARFLGFERIWVMVWG